MPLLHYVEFGDARQPCIVIIHGLFGSHKNWSRISKQLSSDYHVIAIDCRNHGDSFNALKMDYQLMAEDVVTLLKHLNISSCMLMGHSMGGKIAMQLASDYPDIFTQLIVVDIAPVAYPHDFNELLLPLINLNLSDIKNRNQADQLLKDDIHDDFLRLFLLQSLARVDECWYWKNDWQNIADNMPSIIAAPKLKPSSIPSLFIFGENSGYYSDEGIEQVKACFQNLQITLIPKGTHWLHYEQTELFMQALYDSIKG